VWQTDTNITDETEVSIFYPEKHHVSEEPAASIFYLEDGRSRLLRDFTKFLQECTASEILKLKFILPDGQLRQKYTFYIQNFYVLDHNYLTIWRYILQTEIGFGMR
jgi:hypothetical protein